MLKWLSDWFKSVAAEQAALRTARLKPTQPDDAYHHGHPESWRGNCGCCGCSVDRLQHIGRFCWDAAPPPPHVLRAFTLDKR